jgi:hypothetical protein
MLVALSCAAFAQSSSELEPNMNCIERLEMPTYPRIAELARISGTVRATVTPNSAGAAGDPIITETVVDPTGKLKNFAPAAVQEALRKSRFRTDCSGKSITVVFIFENDPHLDSRHPQVVSYEYPNRFRISVPVPLVQN